MFTKGAGNEMVYYAFNGLKRGKNVQKINTNQLNTKGLLGRGGVGVSNALGRLQKNKRDYVEKNRKNCETALVIVWIKENASFFVR